MLDRASWLLCSGLLLCTLLSVAQAENINIEFSDLGKYAQDYGPRVQIIQQEYDQILAERDTDLQWSNPDISYYLEDVDQSREYQLTIGKQFEMPWAYLKKRSSWNDRVRSAEMSKEHNTREHLTDLRSGYVTVRLFDEYLARLGDFTEILLDASHAATTRHTEGHLSGVEEHLIQMSVISLSASHESATQARNEVAVSWRAIMGIAPGDEVDLSTQVEFKLIDLKPESHYVSQIELQPEFKAKLLLAESLNKRASAERGKFVPALSLYAGLKKVRPDMSGYVAGASLSLPLFNRNRAIAQKYQVESDIARSEMQLMQTQAAGRARTLAETIARSQGALAVAAPHFSEDSEELNSLLYLYEEGWITLNELLNAVQIEVSGLEDYYKQLIQFYQNLFQLEMITGERLVSFEE